MSKVKTFIDTISINTKCVDFFDIPDLEESIEIQPQYVNHAFHGDQVEITLIGEKIKGREQGKVLEVVKRAKDEFVGEIVKHDGKTFVIRDDKRIYVDIFLPKGNVPEENKV